MNTKRIISGLAAIAIVLSGTGNLPAGLAGNTDISASAAIAVVAQGECGDGLNWTLTSAGTLTIEGDGYMDSYDDENGDSSGRAPWYSRRTQVKYLNIGENVRSIGDNAFNGCNITSVTIPESVETICWKAFANCKYLSAVDIPENITDIQGNVFESTNWLNERRAEDPLVILNGVLIDGKTAKKSILIPENVHTIGANAFEGNADLKVVKIPEWVNCICWDAFRSCTNLKTVNINGNKAYIAGSAFEDTAWLSALENNGDTIIINNYLYRAGSVSGEYEVPYGIEYIADFAFEANENINKVIIPETVKRIQASAFAYCPNLSEVELSEGLDYVCSNAFANCGSLHDVLLPISIECIEDHAFGYFDDGDCGYCAMDDFTIVGYEGTAAADYAQNNGFAFETLETPTSGQCGENAFWNVSEDGTLTISGTGGTDSYSSYYDGGLKYSAPWMGQRNNITKVVVEDGIDYIGGCAFDGLLNLTDVEIANSVYSIGGYAFSNTPWLENMRAGGKLVIVNGTILVDGRETVGNVVIPEGVVVIAEAAFANNTALTGVKCPDSAVDIGNYAFAGCVSLKKVVIPGTIGYIASNAFEDTPWLDKQIATGEPVIIGGTYLYKSNGMTGDVVIPDGIKNVGEDAFRWSEDLTSVTFPASFFRMHWWAFADCPNLREVNFSAESDNISIGGGAFVNCGSLERVDLPINVTQVEENAFGYDCDFNSYEFFKRDNFTISCYDYTAASRYAFENDFVTELVENTAGQCGDNIFWELDDNGTLTINGEGEMWNYFNVSAGGQAKDAAPWYGSKYRIKKVVISDSINRIGNYAFCNLEMLTDVDLPDNLTDLGEGSFMNCPSLNNITLPDGINIDWRCFEDCSSLRNVTFLGGIGGIGGYVFSGTAWLDAMRQKSPLVIVDNIIIDGKKGSGKVTVKANIRTVAESAFEGNENLTGVTIESNETYIGWFAFNECTNLKTVVFKMGVPALGNCAFSNTAWMNSLLEKSNIAETNGWIFDGSNASGKVTIPDGTDCICNFAFFENNNITSVKIGATGQICYESFAYCNNLESVTIAEGMFAIGERAFFGCPQLRKIIIPESVEIIGDKALGFYDDPDTGEELKNENLVIYCYENSMGHKYASEYGFNYMLLKAPEKANPQFTASAGTDSISLNWKAVSGAEKYGIAGEIDGKWQLLYQTSDTAYTMKNLKAGTSYRLAVIAKFNGEWNMDFANAVNVTTKQDTSKYPVVTSEVSGRQFRLKWTAVPNAEKYGIAVYQSGGWRVKAQMNSSVRTFTSPKMKTGKYKMVVCAKVNGAWDTGNISGRAFTVTIQ